MRGPNAVNGDESVAPFSSNDPRARCQQQGTTAMKEDIMKTIPGEDGSGGKPMKKNNPYLEIDLIDPDDPIRFQGML